VKATFDLLHGWHTAHRDPDPWSSHAGSFGEHPPAEVARHIMDGRAAQRAGGTRLILRSLPWRWRRVQRNVEHVTHRVVPKAARWGRG
jgi:hypothetical protein